MNIFDSSLWIEYFSGSKYADIVDLELNDTESLIVPVITITEVFKWILRENSESEALQAISVMKNGKVVPISEKIAINSAYFGVKLKLPLADSLIYATAHQFDATIYTLDQHFKFLPNVKYFEKK